MGTPGLSKSRLERMHQVLSGFIERKEIPGLVALVSHHDDVHVETLGTQAFDDPSPMKSDTIFRIASITKLITAVAAMILVEECKIRLDDSIEPWLPELANRRELKSLASHLDNTLDDTVPAERAITLRDLLTYRMGFGSIMAMPGTYPIQKLIREYRRRSHAAVAIARGGGMAAEARLAPAAGATGRALDVSRERRCPRGPDRAGLRTILRRVPARAHLRSLGHGGHSIPRAC